jgi:hypothetical protein
MMDYVAVNGGGTHPGALRHPPRRGRGVKPSRVALSAASNTSGAGYSLANVPPLRSPKYAVVSD